MVFQGLEKLIYQKKLKKIENLIGKTILLDGDYLRNFLKELKLILDILKKRGIGRFILNLKF